MHRNRPASFWLGAAIFGALCTVALLAPLLAPDDPRLPTGRPLQPPGAGHPLGTNDLGQDVLSQLIYGTRTTLAVAAGITLLSTSLSWVIGLTAGLVRRAEAPLMALTDLVLALPSLPLYLLVLTLVGPSRLHLILALGLLSWPGFARIVRGIAVETRTAPYVEAARALGATAPHLARRHLLPATLAALPTKLILTVRFAVFAEATLAFLGLAAEGTTSWGTMLSWVFADPLLFSRPVWPWLVLPPCLAIAALVLASLWLSEGIAGVPERRRPPRARPVRARPRLASGIAPWRHCHAPRSDGAANATRARYLG
jgi:ABC-type dipeptide/oligopeptide/nickel transport system permease subunit